MAKFCTQCGRPLKDGEICTCQQKKNNAAKMEYTAPEQKDNSNATGLDNAQQSAGYFDANGWNAGAGASAGKTDAGSGQQGQAGPAPENTQAGTARGNTQAGTARGNAQTSTARGNTQAGNGTDSNTFTYSFSTADWVPFGKLLGFGESEKNDVTGCFERGKKIVPELVAPCEQEIPVKQYDICNARSKIRGLWQEGRLQVTNKRILFRMSGRSWIGRVMDYKEFNIDEVAGISISNGVRFGLFDFIIGLLIAAVIILLFGARFGIEVAFSSSSIFRGLMFLIANIGGLAAIGSFFIVKKKYFIKLLIMSLATGLLTMSVIATRSAFLHGFSSFLSILSVILTIVSLFLFSLKPSMSIMVQTKCESAAPICILSPRSVVSVTEVLPGDDADIAIEELGSMIMDIQKLGDYGIKKWKED